MKLYLEEQNLVQLDSLSPIRVKRMKVLLNWIRLVYKLLQRGKLKVEIGNELYVLLLKLEWMNLDLKRLNLNLEKLIDKVKS